MKEETITLRVSSNLKEGFKKICESENTDMSDKLNQFISDEVKKKTVIDYEQQIELFLGLLGYDNIHILKYPTAGKSSGGKVYQECCSTMSLLRTSTIRFQGVISFSDFLLENSDKEIYIYLMGSNLPNEIRYFTLDKEK